MRKILTAVVVSYNRAAIIGTCLRALRFADEVIVVDKTSTDGTAEIAARHADRVITVPWTPAVEDTRAFAAAQCSGDWILCLDDDECLSPQSGTAIRAAVAAPQADIYCLPLKHYIMGVHDPAAYYWPEHHPRLFRRGAVAFGGTVHGGTQLCSDRIMPFPPESGVAIHHLSHRDVWDWVEKCNRYTSRPDRVRADHAGHDLAGFAHARIDHWQGRGSDTVPAGDAVPGGYPAAVALLRAVYDMIDRLKTWEEERGLDGAVAFAAVCERLDAAYGVASDGPARAGLTSVGCPAVVESGHQAEVAALAARIAALRSQYDTAVADAAEREARAVRWSAEAERLAAEANRRALEVARLDQALSAAQQQQETLQQKLRIEQERVAAIEGSTSWRATAGARRLAERMRRVWVPS